MQVSFFGIRFLDRDYKDRPLPLTPFVGPFLPTSLVRHKGPSHLQHGPGSAGHFGLFFFTCDPCICKYNLNVGLSKNASVYLTS